MGKKRKKFHPSSRGLRAIALLEGAKGALVLLVGFGLLALIHHDLHAAAEQLVRHFHINPASHYPRVFLDLSGRLTDMKLWSMALGAMFYAAIRFAEAYGLWKQRPWAEWFGLLSGGMYIPIELYEVVQGITWPRMTVLAVNGVVVAYLLVVVVRSKGK
ncbi:DUF2127 domain-containing protein [Geomobilimonas luticola]|uniref:DUF2127 domain-containing protein n=1 Tax=Geomobilimonas luticola TaxID=1114878 RepID=A0ABS5SAL2_9BACT|nr:DUF2127 domain-containing protein [Geomobilimonas luticola]MBT0652408.1 DUF2127 domain-containing protein [Geomobilimonas luticola]